MRGKGTHRDKSESEPKNQMKTKKRYLQLNAVFNPPQVMLEPRRQAILLFFSCFFKSIYGELLNTFLKFAFLYHILID